MFLIAPGLYGITAPVMGYLGDKGVGGNLCHPIPIIFQKKWQYSSGLR